jgi:hypothetical protein
LTPDPTFFSTERRKIRTGISTDGKRKGIPKGKDTIQ